MEKTLEEKIELGVEKTLSELKKGDRITTDRLKDLLCLMHYGQLVFSQFGLGFLGVVFRQRRDSVLMTIKVVESGVPLVAFVTSATTMGCVEHLFDMLYENRIRWQKDKFPWI